MNQAFINSNIMHCLRFDFRILVISFSGSLFRLSNVKAIAFKQTMNQDDLLDEITKVAVSFDTAPTIIVDIAGGFEYYALSAVRLPHFGYQF